MIFSALLVKELRLRLRRERSIWIIIVYLLVMGLLGFLYMQAYLASNVHGPASQLGGQI